MPKTSLNLSAEAQEKIKAFAQERKISQSAALEAMVTTPPAYSPVDTNFAVDPRPEEPVYTGDAPWQLWAHPFRAWNPDALLMAKDQADAGNMEFCSDLWESMLADERISSAVEQRALASESLPLSFVGSPRGVKRLEAMWKEAITPGLRVEMFRWGWGPGICPVYVGSWSNGQPGNIEVWNPRWLRYYWWERRWKILTMNGIIDLGSQPGRWYLFTPFGQPNSRPWVSGFWYSLASLWLIKAYALPDWANFGQQHASPKWFMNVIDGNATINKVDKANALKWLAKIPQRTAMFVPYPFKVDQMETNSTAWQSFVEAIKLANVSFAQRILGHDASMDKDATHASGLTALDTKLSLVRYDVDAEREFWRQGLIFTWASVNGISGPTPYPDRDTTPPEDLKDAATTQKTAAEAIGVLVANELAQHVDIRAYLGRYFPLLETDGSADETASTDGIQLSLEQIPDSCVVRLSASSSTVTLLSGSVQLADVTNFPKKGDDKKVGLRNSQWSVFDPDYAADLKENWPEIWKAGGNIRGNDQYRKLKPVVANGGVPSNGTEENAVRLREAWGARHYGDHLLAGVVAQIKWFVVGELGESGMKVVIQEKKDKIRESRKASLAMLQVGQGPDVRQQARDALGYRDELVDALQEREALKQPAEQVLKLLRSANGYDDARAKLLQAFPGLSRDEIRNLLTGGMLLAQAAGRLTAGKENG